jgi:hypothetical protein
MRIIRFYHRLKNQYRIHKYGLSLSTIIKIAWSQSKLQTIEVVIDRSVIPIINIDDEIFPDLFLREVVCND